MIVHETPHWRVNHRVKCPVPGYLMVGANLTLFIWREYCENPAPPSCPGLSVSAAVARVRARFEEIECCAGCP